jgi:hypothetical protein
MKDDDMCRGGEITELARLLPVPPERELPAGREHILKEHLMSEFRKTGTVTGVAAPPAAARHQRRKRRVLVAATGAGVAAAAAVAIGLAVPGSRPAPPPAGGQVSATAAALLAKVADAAARQPVPAVRDDQYMYLKQEIAYDGYNSANSQPDPGKDVLEKQVTQVWTSVSDRCRPGLAINRDGREPLDGKGARCPNPGGLNDPTYRFMQSLPTDPRVLLNLIYTTEKGHGQAPNQEAFTTIGDMLIGSIAPPQVTAALYRTAALIPGVTVVPHAVDAIGRPGVAVAFTWRGFRSEWVFDKKTLTFLGSSNVSTATGKATGKSAVLQRAIVDHLGQVPRSG